jgi:uncharacterized integral membrane protein
MSTPCPCENWIPPGEFKEYKKMSIAIIVGFILLVLLIVVVSKK